MNRRFVLKFNSFSELPQRLVFGALALILVTTFSMSFLFFGARTVFAGFSYHIPKQQDQITINEDGSCRLVRYFEFFVNASSQDKGTEIWAGLPTSRTKVLSVKDQDGRDVPFQTRSEGGEYLCILKGFSAIKPGTSRGFTITADIPNFIFPDTRNEGYATMQYSPGFWSESVKVQDIAIVLPGKVQKSEIKTGSRLWDGIAQTKSGAYVVTWQFKDLKPNEKASINVGFPEKYVKLAPAPKPEPSPSLPPGFRPPAGIPGSDGSSPLMLLAVIVPIFMILAAVFSAAAKQRYSAPQVSMEGIGVNENLTAIEASVLLGLPPEKTLTLLMFSLLKKGILRAYSGDPLRLAIEYDRDLSETEKLFLDALDRTTGELDPKKFTPCYRYIVTSVNEKMKPYCRRDTEAFYRKKVSDLWREVELQSAPELKLSAMDSNILWLLQDDQKSKKAMDEFRAENKEEGRGKSSDSKEAPSQESYPDYVGPFAWLRGFFLGRALFGYPLYGYYGYPGYPFFAFFPHIYSGFSDTSKNMLSGQEAQFREIREAVFTPAPAKSSSGSFKGGGHGGFTPPSCACACACVSCACACACAGGGGCT